MSKTLQRKIIEVVLRLLADPDFFPLVFTYHARGKVHVRAEEILALDVHDSAVNPCADFDPRMARVFVQAASEVEGNVDRLERHHEAIAEGFDGSPVELLDEPFGLIEVIVADPIHALAPKFERK